MCEIVTCRRDAPSHPISHCDDAPVLICSADADCIFSTPKAVTVSRLRAVLNLKVRHGLLARFELLPPRTLYVVRSGIIFHGRQVMTAGKVFGDDVCVESPPDEFTIVARCMTYVEVSAWDGIES